MVDGECPALPPNTGSMKRECEGHRPLVGALIDAFPSPCRKDRRVILRARYDALAKQSWAVCLGSRRAQYPEKMAY